MNQPSMKQSQEGILYLLHNLLLAIGFLVGIGAAYYFLSL